MRKNCSLFLIFSGLHVCASVDSDKLASICNETPLYSHCKYKLNFTSIDIVLSLQKLLGRLCFNLKNTKLPSITSVLSFYLCV